ncbi:MAG: PEP-CTERM sorting domain-containing protein [Planctomycetia bacterium]|nr:PEP-CTERM sorting domain-containing protein [Planctomycetia bacterium]
MSHFAPPPQFRTVAVGFVFLSGFIFSSLADSATYYWFGTTDPNWNTPSNWSTTKDSYTAAVSSPTSFDTVYLVNTTVVPTLSDSAAGLVYINGDCKITFSAGKLTNIGRFRLGYVESSGIPEVTIDGAEIVSQGSDGGITLASTTPALLNIRSGTITNGMFFNLHAKASTTLEKATFCNMSGGTVFVEGYKTYIGEQGHGIMNLTGGTFYGSGFVTLGANANGVTATSGHGYLNIGLSDGSGNGEMYVGDYTGVRMDNTLGTYTSTLQIGYGRSQIGELALHSGLLSVKNIHVNNSNSCATFYGGILVNDTFRGDFTNEGSTIEMASDFAVTQEKINSLGDGETFFTKYQDGTIGSLTVSGTFAQTAGKLVFDIASDENYDTLEAHELNIHGGILEIQFLDNYFPTEETYYDLFRAVTDSSDWSSLVLQVSSGSTSWWSMTDDGRLRYQASNQVPEPATWCLLLLGLGFLYLYRR